MKLLHITSITNPKGNGVAVAVSNYYKYEKELVDVAVYNMESDVIMGKRSYNGSRYKKIADLPDGFSSPDLVVFNEVYKPVYLTLYKECIKANTPYIIIPHGCLTRESQKKNKMKKMIANALLFNRFIDGALAIQYLNTMEWSDTIVRNDRSIISGNGIEIKEKKNKSIDKTFIYIGRYDVKVKGLDLLVEVVAKNKEWFIENGVTIQLYGRNSGNGYNTMKKIIKDNGISDIIFLNDAVYGKKKEQVLLRSYAFIQVSRHEGQPMGIMEALSYGLPCIVTYDTSFGEYVNVNTCGIGIRFSSKELFNAIRYLFENKTIRDQYAVNTSKIKKDYAWDGVIKNCINEYKFLLNQIRSMNITSSNQKAGKRWAK